MSYPADLRYTESHEWVRLEGDVATVGITAHAQDALGELVHVELPEEGASLDAGEGACEVESTKAVSDVYAPVAGTVVAVNEALDDAPESVNEDPYGAGWLFKLEVSDPGDVLALMDAKAYAEHVDSE